MMVVILLASSLVTSALTFVTFYVDYDILYSKIENQLDRIKSSNVPVLSTAVRDGKNAQVEILGRSLMNLANIMKVEVLSEKGQTLYLDQKLDEAKLGFFHENYSFALHHDLDTRKEAIGELRVVISDYDLWKQLGVKMASFFVTQSIKTIIISMVIFALFQNFVTRHIEKIHKLVGKFDFDEEKKPMKIELARSKSETPDELDNLVGTINQMSGRLFESHNLLKKLLDRAKLELKEQKVIAEESARLAGIGQLAAGVAHEINNPIAIISGVLRIIRVKLNKSGVSNEQLEDLFGKVDNNVERIAKVTEALLFFARENSDGARKSEKTDVRALVENTLLFVQEHAEKKNVNVEVDKLPEVAVQCQRSKIIGVLVNLISNSFDALQSNESNKEVRVSATIEEDGFVKISIRDNGTGVPEEIREHIFEPFFTTKEVGEGMGLGLSTSRGIARTQKGELWLDPDKDFTTFHLTLPLAEAKGFSSERQRIIEA